jgi:hypothetical protein
MTIERVYRSTGDDGRVNTGLVVVIFKEGGAPWEGGGQYVVAKLDAARLVLGDVIATADLEPKARFSYNGAPGGVQCGSGTDALWQAIRAARVEAGLPPERSKT